MLGERELAALTEKVAAVSDIYAVRCDIRRDSDWYLLKLQEELGELTAEVLRCDGRARQRAKDNGGARDAVEDEAADLFAHLLLFCRYHGIDVVAALERKWFAYLPPQPPVDSEQSAT